MSYTEYQINFPSIVFAGQGSLLKLKDLIQDGQSVLLLTNKVIVENHGLDNLLADFEKRNVSVSLIDNVAIEPLASQVQDIVDICRNKKGKIILAVGGGSVIDTAKIVSILCDSSQNVYDLLQNPKAIQTRSRRLILIPTTAGTGAEVTPNAIVTDAERELKVGIVNSSFIPDAVILDANLTMSLPPSVTASTGMDALAHALECYISKKANPLSDTFAIEAMRLIFANLPICYSDPTNQKARCNMLYASFLGGLCIAASSTVAVHALSYPLGGRYHIPHGISNAMLLKPVMAFNKPCIQEKLYEIAVRCLNVDKTINKETASDIVIDKLSELTNILNIPTDLKNYGITIETLNELATEAFGVKRLLDNNPRNMSIEEIVSVYEQLL